MLVHFTGQSKWNVNQGHTDLRLNVKCMFFPQVGLDYDDEEIEELDPKSEICWTFEYMAQGLIIKADMLYQTVCVLAQIIWFTGWRQFWI